MTHTLSALLYAAVISGASASAWLQADAPVSLQPPPPSEAPLEFPSPDLQMPLPAVDTTTDLAMRAAWLRV